MSSWERKNTEAGPKDSGQPWRVWCVLFLGTSESQPQYHLLPGLLTECSQEHTHYPVGSLAFTLLLWDVRYSEKLKFLGFLFVVHDLAKYLFISR